MPHQHDLLGILTEQWVPSEVLVVTGILISSVLLFVGTFGFEMFRHASVHFRQHGQDA